MVKQNGYMILNENEAHLVYGVLNTLCRKSYDELNTFLGTETIQGMLTLCHKMKMDDYCKRIGVAYEDLTEDDYNRYYEETMGC